MVIAAVILIILCGHRPNLSTLVPLLPTSPLRNTMEHASSPGSALMIKMSSQTSALDRATKGPCPRVLTLLLACQRQGLGTKEVLRARLRARQSLPRYPPLLRRTLGIYRPCNPQQRFLRPMVGAISDMQDPRPLQLLTLRRSVVMPFPTALFQCT